MSSSLEARLDEFVGSEAEPPRVARYAVNEAMIRNWVEAHDDYNPAYVDQELAESTGRPDVICPPAMVSTWVMAGYRRHRELRRLRVEGVVEDFAYARLTKLLDDAGYCSVVATNVEHEYFIELYPGDLVTAFFTIEAISPVKRTALGEGVFITLLKRYLNQDSETVTHERFGLLRFAPDTSK